MSPITTVPSKCARIAWRFRFLAFRFPGISANLLLLAFSGSRNFRINWLIFFVIVMLMPITINIWAIAAHIHMIRQHWPIPVIYWPIANPHRHSVTVFFISLQPIRIDKPNRVRLDIRINIIPALIEYRIAAEPAHQPGVIPPLPGENEPGARIAIIPDSSAVTEGIIRGAG